MNANLMDEDVGGRFSGNQVLMAFLGGALAGVAIALLTAPQSGSETRESVRGWVGTAREKASRIPDALRSAGQRASSAARDAYNEARSRSGESEGLGGEGAGRQGMGQGQSGMGQPGMRPQTGGTAP